MTGNRSCHELFIRNWPLLLNIAQNSFNFSSLTRVMRHRVANFCDAIVNTYTPDEFKMHFRMTRATTEVVYGHISQVLIDTPEECLCDYIPGDNRQYVSKIY